MTDEEMAGEYIDRTRIVDENTRVGTDCISLVQDYEGNYIDIHERIKQAFLAGLKAGRPQWHNLRKDPKDLPSDKHGHVVMNQDWDKVTIRNGRFEYLDGYKTDIIAWCEIPTFDKE